MSYMIDKFNEGEVKFHNSVAGWEMDDGEFRPLMKDAMTELFNNGNVSMTQVAETHNARIVYEGEMLAIYIESQKNRSQEQIREYKRNARAAFGPNKTITNCLTGTSIVT